MTSPDTDQAIDAAHAAIERSRGATRGSYGPSIGRRSRAVKLRHGWKKFVRFFIAAALILLAAGVVGAIIDGIGLMGVMIVALLVVAAGIASTVWPRLPDATPDTLAKTDLARLPAQAELFLERQRPALPPPARTIVDGIGARLDELGDQLKNLDAREPAAEQVRKLVAEDLPELITGYRRVPQSMRGQTINGRRPDDQLVDGLRLIEREIGTMAEQIAAGDLDRLATRKRYLELKYSGADDSPSGV